MIRVNPVSRMRIDGATASTVTARMIRMLDVGFFKLLPKLSVT